MLAQKRHQGYIANCSHSRKGNVWKVRVADKSSDHNGKYFQVANFCDNFQPARGLNVTFLIGSVDNNVGERESRAVDVRLLPA